VSEIETDRRRNLNTPGAPRRLKITHSTGFRYEGTVAASYNEARMTPLNTAVQTVLAARVSVDPVTWTFSYKDYWDTQVTAFDVLVPHSELAVVSSSTVEVHAPSGVSAREGRDPVGWESLSHSESLDLTAEFTPQTASTTPHEEVIAMAAEAAGDLPPDRAARAVCEQLRSEMEYVPGSTVVTTDAAEAWADRKGVCQDFAHLTIGALRTLGVPARYVSGYLHPTAEAAIGETVQGETHAWIEWWAGDWVAYDPTSLRPAGQDHVVVARGRDYTDVTPLKGIFAGRTLSSELYVSVEVTRLT
jgi:transglutaminase-like putative cysteine protease